MCDRSNNARCCPRCDCECGLILNGFALLAAPGGTASTASCRPCSGSCFPAGATVRMETGKSVAMSELQIGDQVQTGRT